MSEVQIKLKINKVLWVLKVLNQKSIHKKLEEFSLLQNLGHRLYFNSYKMYIVFQKMECLFKASKQSVSTESQLFDFQILT